MSSPDPNSVIPNTAPFTPEEAQWLSGFLGRLEPDQLLWLEGFVSGLRMGRIDGNRASADAAAPASGSGSGSNASSGVATAQTAAVPAEAAPAGPVELTVLYGSESGNAEELADRTAKYAKESGFKPKVLNMADIEPKDLEKAENILVLVSTWGEGDPPENAVDFYEGFMGEKAPAMKNTRYSVLGLGDTSYEEFCKMGKDYDARLEKLGAERIFGRQDCDVDYEEDFEAWCKGALEALQAATRETASRETASPAQSGTGNAAAATQNGPPPPPPAGEQAGATATAAPAAEPVKYTKKNPYSAPLAERLMLNGRGSAKETIHLEFDLAGSGLTYEVGDSLAVVPHNAEDVVEDILNTTGLDAESPVSLKDGDFTLRQALTSKLDITTLSLPVVNRYAEITRDEKLDRLLDKENKKELQDYLYGREIIDLLHDFPTRDINSDVLVGMLRKLPPRLYSIASSLKAHPEEVHLTVAVVRYDTHGRQRKGVCSTYLADRVEKGDTVEVYPTANKNFKLPSDPDTPIIMVGPGTGIAPFRAFVEERKATGAQGKNWLFFGDQHYLTDFLYQAEWQEHLKDGTLSRLDVAFSRDQREKIYVQHKMLEHARDLYAWLEEGAVFYVCGDANRMAVDVDKALHEIIEKEAGLGKDEAADYVKKLKSEKRYLRDIY